MTSWSPEDLERLGGAGEVEVRSVHRDGSLSRPRTVWIVRVGDELYLRSVNGPDAAWYRSTRTAHRGQIQARGVSRDITWTDVETTEQPDIGPAVDAEYARKYQGSPSAVAHINGRLARTTTMRVEPR
jgi:hypothetical protein